MKFLEWCNENILWGLPMIVMMLGCGIYLTWMTKGLLYRNFGLVIRSTLFSLFSGTKKEKKGISPFQAVSAALAGTVGTGNMIGVSIAISTGGPGAIFWMWISAFVGMMTKFSEVTLAVAYREKNKGGEWVGGPMYYISKALGQKWLSLIFCVFGVLCSFGVGNMVQSNAIADSMEQTYGIPCWITGIAMALLGGMVLVGGVKRIVGFTSFFVPFMTLFYLVASGIVLYRQRAGILDAFLMIFYDAFQWKPAGCGVMGYGISRAVRIGIARGIFTNEAGLGSAPIAHATAQTDHPVRQGMWGAFEVFFDTIVMCTLSALVILSGECSGWDGGMLLQRAFSVSFPEGAWIVSVSLSLFAFATIIAWYYYGETCMNYLTGQKNSVCYTLTYVGLIFMGGIMKLNTVWEFADFFNGMMAIPNLIALFLLGNEVKKLVNDFFISH